MITAATPRAVIFDWDNTLVDSWGAIGIAVNYTRAHFNMPAWSDDEIKANCTRSARESFPEWFGDRWQEASDIFYVRFSDVQMKNLRPLAGSEALLAWLQTNAIPACVVSNKKGSFLRDEAQALGWTGYFASIVGAGDAARDKPAREHADHALERAGLIAGPDIWFIGDSEADMLCARNAGCTPILIGTAKIAFEHKIDMYFDDCTQLLGLISKRCSEYRQ